MLISIAHMIDQSLPSFSDVAILNLTITLQVSSESQFEYAWCLVRSRYPADIRKGIILLEDLFQVKQ